MDKNYLSEQEEIAIRQFLNNKDMYQAVRKVLLASIYHQGRVEPGKTPVDFNFAFNIANEGDVKSDEQLGQELRACVKGLGFLKAGFDRLLEFLPTSGEKPEKKVNPGR